MRAVVLTLAILISCAAISALRIESIVSRDLPTQGNQVLIELSDPGSYKVQRLADGKGVQIVVLEVESMVGDPVYPGSSPYIDRVSASFSGLNAVIEVRTKGSVSYAHRPSADRTRITLTLDPPPQELRSTITPPAEPEPAPTLETESAESPSTSVPEVDERPRKLGVQPDSYIVGSQAKTRRGLTGGRWCALYAPWMPLLAGLLALALLALLLWSLLRKKAPRKPITPPTMDPESSSLLLESETRRRMIQRLLDQGWSKEEIAREMKLSLTDVEQLLVQFPNPGPEHGD